MNTIRSPRMRQILPASFLLASAVFFSLPSAAQDGHALVQDEYHPGTRVDLDGDQDEVYRAVQNGDIRPFSEMYAAVERDLHGRIIQVELDQDDGIWIYELKLNQNNNIIKVEYNAASLEMLEIKGRHFRDALKPTE
ncbi:PepSY domain-containing protein [Vibrio scophthalmi]|uniref:PepSY domain-containing protein n=1 Tax=Vibrio scophthalmi TaxID=45658 RepID=UPI003B526B3E